ncbi:hypothetical protein COTS27_00917 [Spirochaetota bacterium]|nr:hypothetical protein COTS27_00917 [Spirochaetota bacterium]
MVLQSSTLALRVGGVKINLVYTIIITVILVGSINFGLALAVGVGFGYDILSSSNMGFYMTSYFLSVFPLIFWAEKLRTNLIFSLFLVLMFGAATFKMMIELMLLLFIYDGQVSSVYFKKIGLLEVVLTTAASALPYSLAMIWKFLRK